MRWAPLWTRRPNPLGERSCGRLFSRVCHPVCRTSDLGWVACHEFQELSPKARWSVLAMAVVLWVIWRYLGGSWWPAQDFGSTKENSARPSGLGHRLASFIPCRRAGYRRSRGYCQQILERHFSGRVAVLLSSSLFMLTPASRGWYSTKLSVHFLVGIVFGAVARLTNSILTSLPAHIFGESHVFYPDMAAGRSARSGFSRRGRQVVLGARVQAGVLTLLAILVFAV